jgi:hypothetical protein
MRVFAVQSAWQLVANNLLCNVHSRVQEVHQVWIHQRLERKKKFHHLTGALDRTGLTIDLAQECLYRSLCLVVLKCFFC